MAKHWAMWGPRQCLIFWLSRRQKRMPRHFGQTLRDVKAETRIDTITESLAEAKFKTVNNILVDVKAQALVHTG